MAPAPVAGADLQRARELNAEGLSLGRQNRWDEARSAFERSLAIKPHALTMLKIALCERALGHHTMARRWFHQALRRNEESGNRELEPHEVTALKESLSDVEQRIATAAITLEAPDLAIAVDGRPLEGIAPLGPTPLFAAGTRGPGAGEVPSAPRLDLLVDPGTHLFVVSRAGVEAPAITRTFAPGARIELTLSAPPSKRPDPERPLRPKDERSTDELVILYGGAIAWGAGLGISLGAVSSKREEVEGAGDNKSFKRTPNFAVGFLSGVGLAAAGATTVALLDRGRPLRYGVPHSIATGLYVGLEAGVFTGLLTTPIETYMIKPAPAALMWGASAAGAVTGGLVGHAIGTTPGRASLVLSGALWGGVSLGFATGGVVGLATGATDIQGENVQRGIAIGGLVGTSAGAIGAGLLAGGMSPSIARVRFIDLSGIGGGVLGLGVAAAVAELAKGEHPQTGLSFFTSPILLGAGVGMGVGLGVGAFVTRGMERDEPRRERLGAGGERGAEVRLVPLVMSVDGGAMMGAAGRF